MQESPNAVKASTLSPTAKHMEKRHICWITSDDYIEVDRPLMPAISEHYIVEWHIVFNKEANNEYKTIIAEQKCGNGLKCYLHDLRNRRRNLKIIIEYWRILKKIKKKKCGLYYFDIEGLPFFFPVVFLLFNRNKVICAIHHVTPPLGAINYISGKQYMKFVINIFKYFHVYSNNQYAMMQKRYPNKKVFFAPLALIDFGKSDSVSPEDQVVFLYFGYIRDYKRVDILIQAANETYEKTRRKFKVKIYGFCSDWKKYERLIKYPEIFELKIEPIPNKDIPNLFKGSHYFVMPYQDLAQSAALAVAFHYNLPVIASDIDPLKEVIVDGQNGFLFEQGSVESLAAVMMSLLDIDQQRFRKIKENLAEYVAKNYSLDLITGLYVDFFESINA